MDERRSQQQDRQAQQGQGGMGQQNQSDMAGQSQGGVSGLGDSDQARSSGQQGGQSTGRQQQQFDSQGSGQQSGGSGTESRFADQIREHMEVIDENGQHCGTVDHIEGDRIKLSRSDSQDGQHHYVSMSQVSGIEGNKVRLRERGDNDFGMESGS